MPNIGQQGEQHGDSISPGVTINTQDEQSGHHLGARDEQAVGSNGCQHGERHGQLNTLGVASNGNHLQNLNIAAGSQAVAGVLSQHQTPPSCRMDGPTFVPSRLPLHAMVPLKKRERIWRGEFVDSARGGA